MLEAHFLVWPLQKSLRVREDDDAAQGEAGQKDQALISAEVSDMDYLKSRMTRALCDDENDDDGALGDAQASWHLGSSITCLVTLTELAPVLH